MERILIVGCPGAGKSTAARRLAAFTGLPLIHLDRHYWLPGWVRPEDTEWREKMRTLTNEPRWIMDGNYSSTLDLRLASADTLIHLDYSTPVCAWRVVRRTMGNLGRRRQGDELIEGCPERFDWDFFRFVLEYRRKYRTRDMEKMSNFGGVVHRFTAPRDLRSFLAALA